MVYEKLLNEIYAVVSLKYLWREYRPSFVKSESPDWINEMMDMGLEVSQALLPDDGQTKNFIEQYQDYLYKAEYRFGRKLEKLNTSYQQRRHNGLYLFLHPMDENDIDVERLYGSMGEKQKDCAQRFDWVFLNWAGWSRSCCRRMPRIF